MKKVKKAGGVTAYLKALTLSYIPPLKVGVWEILPIALCGFISFLAIYQTRTPYDIPDRLDLTALVFLFALVEFITCAIITSTSRHKPNLQSVFPMTHEKKLVLRLTGGLILSLLWYAILLVALFVLLSLPFLFGGIFLNLWEGLRFYIEMYFHQYIAIDGCGCAFMVFWLVLSYGAAVLCGTLKSNKLRWAVSGGYALFAIAFTLSTTNLLNGGGAFVIRNTVVQNFGALPLAWLWLTAFIIIAVGLCVFAIIYACKQDREIDF